VSDSADWWSRTARYLAARDRFESEVLAFLADCPESVREPLLDRLSRMGVVDDARVAREWCRTQSGKRARGDAWIAAQLRDRGVSADIIAEVLAQLPPESVRIRDALSGTTRSIASAARFLASRGFDSDEIQAWAESNATLSDDAL
jgi:SOS response regulatory protein OraA/RecX